MKASYNSPKSRGRCSAFVHGIRSNPVRADLALQPVAIVAHPSFILVRKGAVFWWEPTNVQIKRSSRYDKLPSSEGVAQRSGVYTSRS